MCERNNFTEKRSVTKSRLYQRTWMVILIITLHILLLYCEINDAKILHFDLPDIGGDTKYTFQCKAHPEKNVERKDESELCKNSTFDDITTYRGETYVFKGDNYWIQKNNSLVPGYPKLISQKWAGLPSNIDAAFSDLDDKYVYFFKGDKFWKYEGETLQQGYPKLIESSFSGVPNDIQATAMWTRGRKLYMFKEKTVWRVDMSLIPFNVSKGYALTRFWRGIPNNVDAALRGPRFTTYIFKNGGYYKFSERDNTLVIDDPPYPRRVASNWFGCSKSIRVIED